ncbi:hypothetical protein UF64_01640 [Thalassospira sp. HJ]|uniref:hypothetical protein n=1 Tax=Thalassospira sp. HJ TaxID=1616823 RepID=UPI0005CF6428|nr:hypothetical protein [Thalassospira sp. HJ]KJE37062.1 hypothetical protein UF64_01640 [Thalassospira sp. HJ]
MPKNETTTSVKYSNKAVAFIDILGFSDLVKSGKSPSEILRIVSLLGNEHDSRFYEIDGAEVCPESDKKQLNLDFKLTQISDCVIVSVEISPCALINLIRFCEKVTTRLLLKEKLLCKGYIALGEVYHARNQVFGPGYQAAVEGEKSAASVTVAGSVIGTPFIEIAPEIMQVLKDADDLCVNTMLSRMVRAKNDCAVVTPYSIFSAMGDWAADGTKSESESKAELNQAIGLAERIRAQIMENKPVNTRAKIKSEISIDELSRSIDNLHAVGETISCLHSVYPKM